jgi:hypothetical protein
MSTVISTSGYPAMCSQNLICVPSFNLHLPKLIHPSHPWDPLKNVSLLVSSLLDLKSYFKYLFLNQSCKIPSSLHSLKATYSIDIYYVYQDFVFPFLIVLLASTKYTILLIYISFYVDHIVKKYWSAILYFLEHPWRSWIMKAWTSVDLTTPS